MNAPCFKQFTDVEFQDVSYTVKQWKNYTQYNGTRKILQGVSGHFSHGQLTAIVGSSGAGKSSLLNALSGYISSGVTGHIKIDYKSTCYITQEDHHQTLLTVEELMNYACDLRLSKKQYPQKQQIIEDILAKLHLNHRCHIKPNKLSGGERKRLSIALELVANPKILFLDEPTSGLDEVTALQCILLLSNLAKQGHTVVCTIHQASASLFKHFDHIYIMGKGHCVYQGPPKALLSFLQYIQRDCPKYYSPADYIIELCEFEEDTMVPLLSNLIENGKLMYTQCDNTNDNYRNHQTELEPPFKKVIQPIIVDHKKSHVFSTSIHHSNSMNSDDEDDCTNKYTRNILNRFKTVKKYHWVNNEQQIQQQEKCQRISMLFQFYIILKMMMLRLSRARIPIALQLIHHAMVGLFVGLIFFNLGNEGSYMFAHLKFCICSVLMITYTQMIIPVLTYPAETKILKKEMFNKWYTLPPYYAALCISRIPLQLIFNALYISIVYWMTGFPREWWRFSMVIITAQMTSFVSEGAGLCLGSTFNIINGSIVGPLSISVFIGVGIYGFDFMHRIPTWLEWFLSTISFMRVACKALILSIFGYGRETLHCKEIFCYFGDPRVLLKFLNLKESTFHGQIITLIIMALFFRVVFYLALSRRCKI